MYQKARYPRAISAYLTTVLLPVGSHSNIRLLRVCHVGHERYPIACLSRESTGVQHLLAIRISALSRAHRVEPLILAEGI